MSNDPQPHPDKILDDAASIIEGVSREVEVMGLIQQYQPVVILASWMLKTLQDAGFSRRMAEEMILGVWMQNFPQDWSGVTRLLYDDDDDDDD